MTRLIGITGTIGSGKSTVGRILSELAVPVIDTDHIVHELLASDKAVLAQVLDRFGEAVKLPDGGIDRAQLGAIVFADRQARLDLEAIVHPAVIAEYKKRATAHGNAPAVAILAPLLFEAGIENEFDEIWAVVTAADVLRKRLSERDKLSDDQIAARLEAQMPQEEKAARANKVIDNTGSVERTRTQIEESLRSLRT